jgi:hypothetical protein
MMKILFSALILLIVFVISSCKPDLPVDSADVKWTNFLQGNKLPTADTSSLGCYVEGYIDGQRFCFKEDKDGIFVEDLGSQIFYGNLPDTNTFKPSGIESFWTFSQAESFKDWFFSIRFFYHEFKINYDGKDTIKLEQYRRDRVKTTTATIGDHFGGKDYGFFVDIAKKVNVAQGSDVSKGERLYASHCTQANSYMKVVSVRQLGIIPDARYSNRREVIYEFEANIGYSSGTSISCLIV